MYSEYKGTRKPMPHELVEQVPLIKEALTAMNICVVTKEGYEADDILGTLAKRAEADGMIVSVVSGDRDLLQLATDNIKIRIPKTKKGTTEIEDYNSAQVVEAYGVSPVEFIDMKALMMHPTIFRECRELARRRQALSYQNIIPLKMHMSMLTSLHLIKRRII